MSRDEIRSILSEYLARFRSWGYAELAEHIGRDCLEHVEGIAADGSEYQMEFQVFWDGKPRGNIRVFGDICVEPQKPLLGFIPIYTSDAVDSFIMSSDGRFVGE